MAVAIALGTVPACWARTPAPPAAANRQPAAAQSRRRQDQAGDKDKGAAHRRPSSDAYAAMPLTERLAIQSDLIWSGDYNGGVNGEFGDRAIAAVKTFQKRNKGKETGILTPAGAQTLAALRSRSKQDTGRLASWSRIPTLRRRTARHSGQARAAIRAGHHRQPLVVGARRGADRDLPRERWRAHAHGIVRGTEEEAAKRRVEYNVLAAGFLRALRHAGPEEILCARPSQGQRSARHDRAVRPGDGRHHAAGRGRDVERIRAVQRKPSTAPAKRKVEYATGIVVSQAGHVVTERQAHRRLPGASSWRDSAMPTGSPRTRPPTSPCCASTARNLKPLAALGRCAEKRRADPDRHRRSAGPGRARNAVTAGTRSCAGSKARGSLLDAAPSRGFAGARRARRPGPVRRHGRHVRAKSAGPPVQRRSARSGRHHPEIPGGARACSRRSAAASADAAKAAVVRVICVRK